MLFPVGGLVKMFQPAQVEVKDSPADVRDYFLKCSELSKRFNLAMYLPKTLQTLGLRDLQPSYKSLPRWGMTVDGAFWGLGISVRPIKEIASGYWLPTPTVVDWTPTKGTPYKTATGTTRLRRPDGRTSRLGLTYHLGGPPHPIFLESLMGWPLGWTDVEPLEMARFQEWQLLHGKF